jgi:uncharacterized membrane protein YbhN (UPF0104 family)
VLRIELRSTSWPELTADARRLPQSQLLLALFLTAVDYVVLAGYDILAFRYIRRALPARYIAGAAAVAYAISHNIGFAVLSGASVRYRFYSRWGVTAEDFSRVVFFYSVTFWVGLCALGGLSLVATPVAAAIDPAGLLVVLGWLLMAAVAAYLVATLIRRTPLRLRLLELPLRARCWRSRSCCCRRSTGHWPVRRCTSCCPQRNRRF